MPENLKEVLRLHYEMLYNLKRDKPQKLRFGKNKDMYNYFAPEHLVQYEEKTYHIKEILK